MARLAFLCFMLMPGAAHACPLCHSDTAEEVRAGIWASFLDGEVVIAILGPFLVLGAAVRILHR